MTRAQRKKLSAQVTPENGSATDTTATSTDISSDPSSNHDLVNVPSSAPLVQTVKDGNSFLDSPSMPNLRVHHPSSDSDSDNNNSASRTPAHISPSVSQAFDPSSQRHTFKRIAAHTGPLMHSHKKYLGSAFNLKVLWSAGVSTWETLDTFFQDAPQDVANYVQKHNLLGNPHWKHEQDYVLNPPKPTVARIDRTYLPWWSTDGS